MEGIQGLTQQPGPRAAACNSIRRIRKAPVVSGRPSACHGYAVACIGQPPPPSAPGPVWRWPAEPLSRDCGGRAFARVDGEGEAPGFLARLRGRLGIQS